MSRAAPVMSAAKGGNRILQFFRISDLPMFAVESVDIPDLGLRALWSVHFRENAIDSVSENLQETFIYACGT